MKTDFTKKAELRNSLLLNGPLQLTTTMLSELLLKPDKFLSNITFSNDYILKIIQKLDSEKALPSI